MTTSTVILFLANFFRGFQEWGVNIASQAAWLGVFFEVWVNNPTFSLSIFLSKYGSVFINSLIFTFLHYKV
jgi:hypothetical protein